MRLRFLAVLFLMALVLALSPVLAAENSDAVAVVIGNKSYSGDRIPDVDYAHRDADAFKRYLTDVLGYREGNIIDLRDATQAKMEAALGNERTHEGTIWQWIRPGESDVTVFYSGHGVPGLKSKRGYLLPVDADPNKPEINGFPVDTLYRNLSKLLARSVTVYLDACFSGDSPKGMLIESASGMTVTPRMPENTKGLVVLTAAQGGQVASWDKKSQHGLFTQHLLEALYGKADKEKYGDGDGKVTLKEVKNYLGREMTHEARREYGRIQQATVKGKEDTVLVAFEGGKPPERPQLGVAPSVAAAVETMDDTLFAQKNANVRESTSAESRKIGTVPKGSEVQVTGKAENWYQVSFQGQTGYVFGKLLGEQQAALPSPQPPEAPPRETTELSGSHPLAGATVANMSPALADELGLDTFDDGVVILQIRRGSNARRLRFQSGDMVLTVNGQTVVSVRRLKGLVAERINRWRIIVKRNGKKLKLVINR